MTSMILLAYLYTKLYTGSLNMSSTFPDYRWVYYRKVQSLIPRKLGHKSESATGNFHQLFLIRDVDDSKVQHFLENHFKKSEVHIVVLERQE